MPQTFTTIALITVCSTLRLDVDLVKKKQQRHCLMDAGLLRRTDNATPTSRDRRLQRSLNSLNFLFSNSSFSRSTQPFTLRKMVKWVSAKGRWCSAAGKVTAGLAESNGSQPPGGWLIVTCRLTACTVHRDQLRAQRSVTSMGSLL